MPQGAGLEPIPCTDWKFPTHQNKQGSNFSIPGKCENRYTIQIQYLDSLKSLSLSVLWQPETGTEFRLKCSSLNINGSSYR